MDPNHWFVLGIRGESISKGRCFERSNQTFVVKIKGTFF